MKYSINGTGNIVAERDIYSLGGLIPKGSVGGKIASEAQLSQEGECWLTSGDISGRPDIVIKDNAYVGTFTPGVNPVHTDGVTEFSGNTLIPGNLSVRSFVADTKNNVFIKDSFIGVSMDVLCGPRTTATAFPFEQGGYLSTAPRGTAFSSGAIQTSDINLCRSTDAVIRCGLSTYVYLPTGYSGRILWAYTEGGTAVYSGESEIIPSGLNKISHPVYKRFMLHITKVDGTAMTPTDLLATGAKILGHISGSLLMDLRPESVSGQYVIDNSSFIMNTDNFGLATTQVRFLAGSIYDTTMYTKTDGQDYKLYGTFRNVERLEYTKYLGDSHRTNANRDTYVSGFDCPLLRVDDDTYDTSLTGTGDLVLRNCILPKASFTHDAVNGNTYEGIDFSYANEFIRNIVAGRNLYSSHREGLYACESNGELLGLISYPGNMDDTARLSEAQDTIRLDGNILESGGYANYQIGAYFETGKSILSSRVRTGKPIKGGTDLPTVPTGWKISSVYHLDENLNFVTGALGPSSLDPTKPYFLILFGKDDDSNISVSDVVALNLAITVKDLYKTPEITGSAYVGEGCTVRGDVQLIGDPYVNRTFDVNLWERGTTQAGVLPNYPTWSDRKIPTGAGNRFRFIDTVPVEPGAKITCNSGYWITCYFFDDNGNYLSSPGWGQIANTAPANSAFVGIIIKKATAASEPGGLIEDSDIPLANVKYLRAFKKRRYITNELDRTSPEDILLKPGDFGNYYVGRIPGETYDSKKGHDANYLALFRPVNVPGIGATINRAVGFTPSYGSLDALTKFISTDLSLIPNTVFFGGGFGKSPVAAILPSEAPDARFIIEFIPSPRIVVPYGSAALLISGPKIRMYDNAVLSRNLNQQGEIVLQGDAVMGYDFNSGDCMCSNGHSDAIIKLP